MSKGSVSQRLSGGVSQGVMGLCEGLFIFYHFLLPLSFVIIFINFAQFHRLLTRSFGVHANRACFYVGITKEQRDI